MEDGKESDADATAANSKEQVRKEADEVIRKIRTRQLYARNKPDSIVIRLTEVILATAQSPVDPRELERAAFELRQKAGSTSVLGGRLRHSIAAMILARNLEGADVVARVNAVRAAFREHHISRGGAREVIAALFLVMHAGQSPVVDVTLDRMRHLLASWRKKHWLVTGPDDYPMAALHACGTEDIDALEARIERIYRALAAAGFHRGNQLQLASHLLAVAPWQPAEAAARFRSIGRSLDANRSKVRLGHYDEIAILSLTRGECTEVARKVVAAKAHLIRTEHLAESLAFSLAVGTFLAEEARARDDLRDAENLEILATIRQALDRKVATTTARVLGVGALVALGFAVGRAEPFIPLVNAFVKPKKKGTNEWRPRQPPRVGTGAAAARWQKRKRDRERRRP